MEYNKNKILRYLYQLDERDYPSSIKRFYSSCNYFLTEERNSVINELYGLKGKCRNVAVLSKKFIDAMDKSYKKFTHLHIDLLEECEGECGVVISPYFIHGSCVVYSIDHGSLTIWVFQTIPNTVGEKFSIPSYYIVVSPKDKIQGDGHQLDCMVVKMLDNFFDLNFRDYIDMVLDYLCLRQWADVEISEVHTKIKKEIKDKKKTKVVVEDGITYFNFDSKWYTEICNNKEFIVSGHFRLQRYGDGSRRLIWINDFVKHGYHRKALIDKVKDGELIID